MIERGVTMIVATDKNLRFGIEAKFEGNDIGITIDQEMKKVSYKDMVVGKSYVIFESDGTPIAQPPYNIFIIEKKDDTEVGIILHGNWLVEHINRSPVNKKDDSDGQSS